jgi:AAA domain
VGAKVNDQRKTARAANTDGFKTAQKVGNRYGNAPKNARKGCGFPPDEAEPDMSINLWRIDNILTAENAVSAIHGKSGAGKTFVTLEMAACISSGDPFLGQPTKATPVMYVCLEHGAESLKRRVAPIRRRYKDAGRLQDFRVWFVPTSIDLISGFLGCLRTLKTEMQEAEENFGERPGLLVIDTLAAATAGQIDENGSGSKGMSAAVANFKKIVAELSCGLLIVHHEPEGAPKLRGHGSLQAECHSIIGIEDGVLTSRKQKDGPDRLKFGFELVEVQVKPGFKGTTCIVKHGDLLQDDKAGAVGSAAKRRRGGPSRKPARLADKWRHLSDAQRDAQVLADVRDNPGASQDQRARALGTHKPKISRHLNRLTDAGKLRKMPGGKYVLAAEFPQAFVRAA